MKIISPMDGFFFGKGEMAAIKWEKYNAAPHIFIDN